MNDGGPAFPRTVFGEEAESIYEVHAPDGMSLLDYFAAAALQGLLANTDEPAGTRR